MDTTDPTADPMDDPTPAAAGMRSRDALSLAPGVEP